MAYLEGKVYQRSSHALALAHLDVLWPNSSALLTLLRAECGEDIELVEDPRDEERICCLTGIHGNGRCRVVVQSWAGGNNKGRGGAGISYLGRCRHESEEQARPLQNLNLQPLLVFLGLQISIEYRYI